MQLHVCCQASDLQSRQLITHTTSPDPLALAEGLPSRLTISAYPGIPHLHGSAVQIQLPQSALQELAHISAQLSCT